jgi:glucan 1,4-alpha-glucosidase
VKNRVLIAAASVCAIVACLAPSIAAGAARHDTARAGAAAVAPDPPGTESYFDLARKDCVGTARNDHSKVWFTVADGVLSDTYWPTADATNVKTLQYLVTDGHSFTDLQTRDMTYRVLNDPTGMACTVLATSATHHYRIITTYVADPSHDAVVMRTHFDGPHSDQLYVRLDPLAGGTGGGGAENAGANTAAVIDEGGDQALLAANPNTTTQASNRSYAVATDEALRSSAGLQDASVGYAGTASDGLTMLDGAHQLTPYDLAPDGHVTLTARVPLRHHDVTMALGFGTDQAAALTTARASVDQSFGAMRARYEAQWRDYDAGLRRPSRSLGAAARREYDESINVVKASEDKTFPGAIVAGLASPWGQAVPAGNNTNGQPTYFGSYREVFARDLYEAFTALLVAGDVQSARDADLFLFDRQQQPDGSMPRNSLLNGMVAPDTGGLQLDETSYPILMDWQSGLAGDTGLYRQHVIPAADFLVAHGPSDGVERWEEQSGYSPSTIAAEIAGLTAAARIAAVHGDTGRSAVYQATADEFARNIKRWTVTITGPYARSYFLRLSKTGDPNAAINYSLGNGSITADQRSVVDGGFLELVRLGILPASDPTVRASLAAVDTTIKRTTPSGDGFYRYGTSGPGSEDGYGDCYEPDLTNCSPSGQPWPPTDTGSGHLWPVLDGERGEYDIAASEPGGRPLLDAMAAMSSGQGLEPEQAWEDPPLAPSPFGSDPTIASIGFAPGRPAGSASPLTWAQAQYARLALDLSHGANLETPGIVSDRYVEHGMPGALALAVTSPANSASVNGNTVTVAGTTAPGATVAAEADGPAGGTAGTASAVADSGGRWTLMLPTTFGSSTITVTATLGRSSGYARLSITNVALPGSAVLTATDPSGDDDGPGTYAYPTDPSFSPGAFDLLGLQVSQTATDVYIQARIRNLAQTFGTDFGAQLLDVYVRDPAAAGHSTAPAFPQRNYTIAPADAWSQRLEAQGFAPLAWVDPSGASLGNGQLIVDRPSGTATLVLPRSVFGTVGSGWVFTVALTGQDGFSSDQARAFTATPQGFSFGVCASGGSSPICSVDPGTVPTVMDTLTPTGVSQATELDPTHGPVSLQGVAVP